MNILFVCTGNSCRSPMAEMYFNARAAAEGMLHRAGSAGLCVYGNSPASIQAQKVMISCGIDPSEFRSRQFSSYMADGYDLIVAMGSGHKAGILRLCPEAVGKVKLLSEFSGSSADVPDPYGGSTELYRQTFDEVMRPALEGLLDFLNEQNCEK